MGRPLDPAVRTNSRHATVANGERYRICVFTEDLATPLDEGVKKFTASVARALTREHNVALLTTTGDDVLPEARRVCAPRSLLSPHLRSALRDHRPAIVLYVARSSTTFMSFLRTRLLKAYYPRATVVLVGLQPRVLAPWQRVIARLLAPDAILVQSRETESYLSGLGFRVRLLPSGVDLDTFCPVDPSRRRELRALYRLRDDVPVVLHVGHLQRRRGVQVLSDLARTGRCQVLLVASSSTTREVELVDKLRRDGVIVLGAFLPHVEHLYQLADCYVFPCDSTDNSIEVPLSVLEALACDLPVVAMRFGGLPDFYPNAAEDALVLVDSRAELIDHALRRCQAGGGDARRLVLDHSWEAVAATVLNRVLTLRGNHA